MIQHICAESALKQQSTPWLAGPNSPFFPVLPDPHESEFFTKLKTHITELTDDDDHDNDDHDDNDEDIYMDISTAAALLQS